MYVNERANTILYWTLDGKWVIGKWVIGDLNPESVLLAQEPDGASPKGARVGRKWMIRLPAGTWTEATSLRVTGVQADIVSSFRVLVFTADI